MTSLELWEPSEVHLGETRTKPNNNSNKLFVRLNEVNQHHHENPYGYYNCKRNESILHSIEPSLIALKEMVCERYDNDTLDVPIRRTFVSGDRHNQLNANNLSEL